MPCIFCRIVSGDAPSRTVYEDETTQAFLDANPLAPGHVLVVPKEHHRRLRDLPPDVAADLFRTLHALADPIEEAVDADALTVGFNDGRAAGQEVPHVHGHVVPRFRDDGGGLIHSIAGSLPDLSEGDLDDIEDDIERRL